MEHYLLSPEVARRLGLSPSTLRRWRADKRGPEFIRLGKNPRSRVLYRVAAVEDWLKTL